MRVVVITGASDGIGAEMARQLAASEGAGVALVLAARNAELLQRWRANARRWARKRWQWPPTSRYRTNVGG